MEIVIEYVLLDNLIINFLIIYLTSKILTISVKKFRIFLSDAFGTGMALILPLVNLPSWTFIILKLLVGVLMVLLAYPTQSVKKFLLQFFTFLSCTALLGGICFALSFLITGSLDVSSLNGNNFKFPVGVIVAVIASYVFFLNGIIKYIAKKQKAKKFIYDIKLVSGDKVLKAQAYLDSGHNLKDPTTSESVTIINYNLFNKMFDIPLEKILLKSVNEYLDNARYIDIQTINNKKQQMLIFNLDKIEILLAEKTVEKPNAPVGLSLVDFNKNFNCEILISPEIF